MVDGPRNRDSIDHTYQVQLMLYWIDVYSIGTSDHDSFKLLFYPSDTSPVLTPISMPVMNIHPDADDQEEFEYIACYFIFPPPPKLGK